MTKYLGGSFSVALGSEAYRANWDAVFGKKDCPLCHGTKYFSGGNGRVNVTAPCTYCQCKDPADAQKPDLPLEKP